LDRVRELMIAHAHSGLHQVCEQYLYLEEKRFEAWSAHLRGILQPADRRQGGRVAQVDSSCSACPKILTRLEIDG
jgi:hypothetical protein